MDLISCYHTCTARWRLNEMRKLLFRSFKYAAQKVFCQVIMYTLPRERY